MGRNRWRGGGHRRNRPFRGDRRQKRKDEWDQDRPRGDGEKGGEFKYGEEQWSTNERNYKMTVRTNELFENFYKAQNIVPEGEWDEFLAALKKDLPVTFRITGSRREAKQLLEVIKGKYFNGIVSKVTEEGLTIEPPKSLPWYPDEFAWQLEMSRQFVRNSQVMKRLHEVLIAETESGNISRQEAVSMLPPMLMDIQSDHKILDMCAAPGSKTAQLIEMLHGDEQEELPEGFVIANDVDNKRCYLMTHQVKRLQSPNIMIVNEDASVFPKIRTTPEDQKPQFLLFDRILTDVPCSGDATMRKNPDVWAKWKPSSGPNLHFTQIKILKRGLELLNVGGRLVYSTCSFNPCENEAVVAELLRRCQGTVEIVDVSNKFNNLKYVPGLTKWKCMSHDGEFLESFENVPQRFQGLFRPSLFSPTDEETQWMNLERCIRILPHHQDTGGFFMCALEKVKTLPWMKEYIPPVPTGEEQSETAAEAGAEGAGAAADASSSSDYPPRKKPRVHGYKEDPFLFLEDDDAMWPHIKEFYSIPDDFPVEQVMYRSYQGTKKHLYFVSSYIRSIALNNVGRIKFINMGIKLLSRNPSPNVPECDFRINQECLAHLHKIFQSRCIPFTREDLLRSLTEENPYYFKFSAQVQEQVVKIGCGSTVFHYKPPDENADPICDVYLCGWKGKLSIRAFVGYYERQHFLLLCGKHVSEIREQVEKEKAERKALEAQGIKVDRFPQPLFYEPGAQPVDRGEKAMVTEPAVTVKPDPEAEESGEPGDGEEKIQEAIE